MKARSMRGSHIWNGLAAAVLATGCFSIPEFTPEGAVTFTATETGGGGGTVAGTGFALKFGDGPGLHFPDALLIDGADVMGHDMAQTCFESNEAGLRIVPTARIGATGGAPAMKNDLVPVLRGPAVVQMKLDWATQFQPTCGTNRAPGGISTFTVFPDGRIVRFDTLADAVSTEIVPSGCECATPTRSEDMLFTLSTHWTLARRSFMDLSFDNNTRELPAVDQEVAANHATSCVEGGPAGAKYQVAFAWPLAMVRPGDPLQTAVRGRAELIEFRRDLGAIGRSRLEDFKETNSSAIFIERKGCVEALKRAEEHADPPTLTINGAAATPSPRDGIYGGDAGDQNPPGIAAPKVEVTGMVKSSFAVWVRFPGTVDGIRATLEGAQGAWYMPQRNEDGSWIVWFRDPLMGKTITIEPR